MNIPYMHELHGIWYILSHVFSYPYIHWTKWALIVSAIFLVYPLALAVIFIFFDKNRLRIIRYTFFYHNKNAGFTLSYKKHPVKMFFAPFLPMSKLMGVDPYDAHYSIPAYVILCLGFAVLAAWGFWYLIHSLGWPSILTSIFPLKLIVVYILGSVMLFFYFFGNLSLTLMLIIAGLLNVAYFTNFQLGFPVIPANYVIPTWISGIDHHWVLNPNNYAIDINKYVYVIFLLFTYYSLLRYVLNFFYWKVTRHPPNKLFDQYFSEEELAQRRHVTKAEADSKPFGGVIKNINPDIDLGDDSKPKTFAHEREMKLLGFNDKTIAAFRSQYSDAQIARALDAVMEKGGANPKMTFINELEEHSND